LRPVEFDGRADVDCPAAGFLLLSLRPPLQLPSVVIHTREHGPDETPTSHAALHENSGLTFCHSTIV
jgi:hypothetical protein